MSVGGLSPGQEYFKWNTRPSENQLAQPQEHETQMDSMSPALLWPGH